MKLSSITRKRKRSCFVIPSTLLRKTYANSNNKNRYAIQLAKVKTNSFGTIQIIAKYRSHKSIKNSYVNRGLWRFKE